MDRITKALGGFVEAVEKAGGLIPRGGSAKLSASFKKPSRNFSGQAKRGFASYYKWEDRQQARHGVIHVTPKSERRLDGAFNAGEKASRLVGARSYLTRRQVRKALDLIEKASVTFRGQRMSSADRRAIATGGRGRGAIPSTYTAGKKAYVAVGGSMRGSSLFGHKEVSVRGGAAKRAPKKMQTAAAAAVGMKRPGKASQFDARAQRFTRLFGRVSKSDDGLDAIDKASVSYHGTRMSRAARNFHASESVFRNPAASVSPKQSAAVGRKLSRAGAGAPNPKNVKRGAFARAQRFANMFGGTRMSPANRKIVMGRVAKSAAKTLYVYRPVVNADEIIAWAQGQGIKTTIAPEDMHVTLASSATPINWATLSDDYRADPGDNALSSCCGPVNYSSGGQLQRKVSGGLRIVEQLGSAIVLSFQSPTLTQRWTDFMGLGCSWDFPGFSPHVTISYDTAGVDPSKISPYSGPIILGEECWEEVDPDAKARMAEASVSKAQLADLTKRLETLEKAKAKPAEQAA